MAIREYVPIESEYYKIFLHSAIEYIKNAAKGIIPGISREDLLELLIPIPSHLEQRRIITSVKNAYKYIGIIESNKSDLSTHIKQTKAKVLDLAIRGRLVPQDPNDEPASVLLVRIRAEKEATANHTKRETKKTVTSSPNSHNKNMLFEVPQSWTWCNISELGIISSGGTPDTKNKNYWDGDINWITPSDLSNYKGSYICRGKRNISQEGLNNSSAKIMPSGTVLFSSRAPIGYCVISNSNISTNQGFKSITPYDGVQSEFIRLFLLSQIRIIESMASGTTFKEISASSFSVIKFALPPFNEQKRIVSKVDEIFTLLDNIGKALLE